MTRKYEVVEHHIKLTAPWKRWSVKVGEVTNMRYKIEKLARQREAGDMAPTLSHWTVGDHRVAGQTALQLQAAQKGG